MTQEQINAIQQNKYRRSFKELIKESQKTRDIKSRLERIKNKKTFR